MMPAGKVAVIVNPHSGGGRTRKQWPAVARALEQKLGPLQVKFTERGGDGAALARELLTEGCDLIVAAGGDGTTNEVVNGFIESDQPVCADACLGILPLGTGSDFRRSLGIGGEMGSAMDVLATGAPARIDVGKTVFRTDDGSPRTRYFVNVASFGLGGDVALRVEGARRRHGKLTFLWTALRMLPGHGGKTVRLELDGEKLPDELLITNVAVGNGRFHGGGMQLCPRAELNDGMLDVTVIDRLGAFEFLRSLRILYSDDIYRHPRVHPFRAKRFAAESNDLTRVEIDGEPLGRLPLEVTILPQKLPVMVPRGSRLLAP